MGTIRSAIDTSIRRYAPLRFFSKLRWIWHPVFVFTSLQFVWVSILVLWVILFSSQQQGLDQIQSQFGSQMIAPNYELAFLVAGCILLGILFVGVLVLFVFAQRQSRFVRNQNTFVSSVTHELRSPLSSIQLSFETIENSDTPVEVFKKLTRMISKDVHRLNTLVDRILISSKLDRGLGHFDQKPQSVQISDILSDVLERLSAVITNSKSRIVLAGDPSLFFWTKRACLEQIFHNLIENALKYSPSDSKVTVVYELESDNLVFKVTDLGMGIRKQDRRKIFNRFHRGEMASNRAIPGTGLGLYIVLSAVKELDGRIDVESDDGGTTFTVLIPPSERAN